ncbi:hypothetical protein GCM10028827_12130 [Mucilaginibacter myungsuensis]
MDLHLDGVVLSGKNVLKVRRYLNEPYLWVLADNNEVFRVNTLTRAVEDLTGAFSTYAAGQEFIDIAIVNANVAVVATSTRLLHYTAGSVKVVGAAEGLSGVINSIAFDLFDYWNAKVVLVATDKGMDRYETELSKVTRTDVYNNARIFETSYRNLMYVNNRICGCDYNDVTTRSVDMREHGGGWAGELWKGGAFGNEIKSAYFSRASTGYFHGTSGYNVNEFWATEKGLFQLYFDQSSRLYSPYKHFFQGQSVTKITSIYGLLPFYINSSIEGAQENILVGTKNGLYFSDSRFLRRENDFSFFYCQELGDKSVNDISVNIAELSRSASSYVPAVRCEDGIWVAATDGLYLLRPDYAPYKKNERLNMLGFNIQSGVAEMQICGDTKISLAMGSDPDLFIKWYKDGVSITNESDITYTITQAGEYYAILTDPCSGISKETNHLKATLGTAPTFTFNYPDKLNYCEGSVATLTVDDKPGYRYRWYNQGMLASNNTPILSTTMPGKYRVELTACTDGWVSSKEVEVNFVKVPVPVISADKPAYCTGEQATLTATAPVVSGGIVNSQPYQYQWYRDGVQISGSSATISTLLPGKYKVDVTACAGNTSTSAEFQVSFINITTPVVTANKPSYCIGDQATLSINFINDGTYTVNWMLDGQVIVADRNKTNISTIRSGSYTVSITSNLSNCGVTSVPQVVFFDGTVPTFTFNYPDKLNYCAGSTATLTVDDKPGYRYRWYKDGVLNRNSTATMNTSIPGKYKVELTTCSDGWVPTKEVEVSFIKVPVPTIAANKTAYCAGEQAILTAIVPNVPAGIVNWQAYQYKWFKDGVALSSTSANISVTQPGRYQVEVTACSGNTTSSAEFQLNFINIATPVIAAGKPAYCIGDQATLSTTFVNDGTYTVEWLRNGVAIPAERNKQSISTTIAGNYMVNITSNLTNCSQGSAVYALSFETPPTIRIDRVINTTLCSGQTVDLKATYNGGSVLWSTGETASQISVKNSGTYTAAVSTPGGCSVNDNINVQFLANPVLNVPNATLCRFTNEKITLTAPPGFAKYEWNGQTGTVEYTTGTLGSVTLKVTDINGCTASQTITVTGKCKDIYIPNAFTPNGDGINDKWLIAGLEGDPTVNVKIHSRTGTLLFQSQGYATPWDGTHRGATLPAGVYYYVISAKGSDQLLSGAITIIR